MKLPLPPPDPTGLLSKLQPETLARLIEIPQTAGAGRYLHWDELRHRAPPEGFTLEE